MCVCSNDCAWFAFWVWDFNLALACFQEGSRLVWASTVQRSRVSLVGLGLIETPEISASSGSEHRGMVVKFSDSS